MTDKKFYDTLIDKKFTNFNAIICEYFMINNLITAGGKIICLRCTAKSIRTKLQCARPALKNSRTQKCQFHGGRGSGPQTLEGKARIAQAQLTHGRDTNQARLDHSKGSALLSQLEDCLLVLGMTNGPRIRGRKAKGYKPVRTMDDVKRLMIDLHHM